MTEKKNQEQFRACVRGEEFEFTIVSWESNHGHGGDCIGVDFRVYEAHSWNDPNGRKVMWERRGGSSSNDMTDNLDDAELTLGGFIRWDGCSNWNWGDDDDPAMIHYCSKAQAEAVGQVFARLYVIAGDYMPQYAHEYLH